MIATLTRWARRIRPAKLDHLTVTVYTRASCCCCHKALDLLEQYRKRHHFVIERVDVDSDPELVAKYGLLVPVVAVGGRVRFKGRVDPVLLDRLIWAEYRALGRPEESIDPVAIS
jgi:glutaredoxin